MADHSPELDEQFIRRAIRLAMNGRGRVEPNPMVACVLVKDGRVIGEGYHAQFGGPHAEPTALANCTESPTDATAYVTLEPCCHLNKKTPPCAPRLIEAKIARVVIGCLDPNPDVNGKGVAMLRAAGIQVDGPVLEGAAKQLIAPFLARVQHGRPYVTLKWAETRDGHVAGANGERLAISGPVANRRVHQLRSHSDAILVGIGTVLNDDPALTTRGVPILRNTCVAVLDAHLRLPPQAKLIDAMQAEGDVVVYTSPSAPAAAERRLQEMRVLVRRIAAEDQDHLSIPAALADLGEAPCSHVLIEAGPRLARRLFEGRHVDRVWRIRSPRSIDASNAPKAVAVPNEFVETGEVDLGGDTLTEYLDPNSDVYFATEASADFVLGSPTSSRP